MVVGITGHLGNGFASFCISRRCSATFILKYYSKKPNNKTGLKLGISIFYNFKYIHN